MTIIEKHKLTVTGPRMLKSKDSPEFAWQTLQYIKTCYESKKITVARFTQALDEAETYRIYERIPPGYPSLDALLQAEIGVNKERHGEPTAIVPTMDAMVRAVGEHYNSRHADWTYAAFDHINGAYFDNQLPATLILWHITPYGHCIGQTWAKTDATSDEPPIIILHPTLFKDGERFAYDVLLHECMHVHIIGNIGSQTGTSSHNCDEWVAEVNRIAPLIGIPDVQAGRNKPKRVNGGVMRVSDGNIPMKELSGFPHEVRRYLGLMDYYADHSLPFARNT